MGIDKKNKKRDCKVWVENNDGQYMSFGLVSNEANHKAEYRSFT